MSTRRKLILIELNEVPYRVIDAYLRQRPDSNCARVLASSEQYVTFSEDSLALDPWISWSTLHRGVTDEKHQILHLGQVLEAVDREFPPIWRLLKKRELGIGVFGSLHSSNIPADASSYRFYLPDYFDDKAFAHPTELLPFQRLNLTMTRASARNVTRKVPLGEIARFLAAAPALGLTLATARECAIHLAREVVDKSVRIRRRAYQPLIMADLFLKQLDGTRPDFACFYTNHVAASMHRYWAAAFPEDYEQPPDQEWIRRYEGEIPFAMDVFDRILGRLVSFVDADPAYTLAVASSMGQAAIPAEKTTEFLTITNLSKFMSRLGVPPEAWQPRPAMVPCACVVVKDEYRDRVLSVVNELVVDGHRMRESKRPAAPLSYDERERGFFQFYVQFDSYRGAPHALVRDDVVELGALGLGLMAHEDGVNCTAQHGPDGSLIVYTPTGKRKWSGSRDRISTTEVAPAILNFFGFDAPAYMRVPRPLLG